MCRSGSRLQLCVFSWRIHSWRGSFSLLGVAQMLPSAHSHEEVVPPLPLRAASLLRTTSLLHARGCAAHSFIHWHTLPPTMRGMVRSTLADGTPSPVTSQWRMPPIPRVLLVSWTPCSAVRWADLYLLLSGLERCGPRAVEWNSIRLPTRRVATRCCNSAAATLLLHPLAARRSPFDCRCNPPRYTHGGNSMAEGADR